MWWHILPSGIIIGVCVAIPNFTAWWWNEAFYGNHFRRKLESAFERQMFTRDGRITGAAWIIKGLESIPDD
ncbi:hypothetical protein PV327_005118 [Microctonus hyperodae]|uniref:Uncharacterized protein n=1 Tax=Microctonus hyperodae TaxID=165561 RepID=A0AA39G1J8_MICHY|nr:hypothetical protein PV327_005118 [Microctonus hyperodae]